MMQSQFDEKAIEDILRASLRHVPVYHDEHSVLVKRLQENICISYRTTKNNSVLETIGTTHFSLQITNDVCYILYIELAQNERGKGYGRMLYNAIEDFARDCHCAKVRLTPSGTTVHGKSRLEYMLSLGYQSVGDIAVEKIL